MSSSKAQRWERTIREGLASANRGNPFWSKSDAMKQLNQWRKQR